MAQRLVCPLCALSALAVLTLAGCSRPKPSDQPPPDYARARDLLLRRQFAEAVEELAKPDAAPPAEARFALALAWTNLGKWSRSDRAAEAALRRGLGTPMELPVRHLLLANAVRAEGASGARRALDAFLRCAEERAALLLQGAEDRSAAETQRQALADMAAGREALLQGALARATAKYSVALDLWPDSPCVKLCVSECLRQLGDAEAARSFLRENLPAFLPEGDWRGPLLEAHLDALGPPPAPLPESRP